MVVYLDLVLLVNFGLNFLFLLTINLLFHDQTQYGRVVLSSLVACLFLVVFLFDYFLFLVVKVFGGLLLVGVGLGFNRLMGKASVFYLLQFSLSGLVDSFHVDGLLLLVAIFCILVLVLIQRIQKERIFKNVLKYNISVTFGEVNICTNAFLDTGNIACVDQVPIVIIDSKYKPDHLKSYKQIKIQSIHGEQIVCCYKPDRFVMQSKRQVMMKEVLIVFEKLQSVECLLNYYLIQ